MKFLQHYNKCIFCGSTKRRKNKNQKIPKNFYLKAIQNDFNISNHLLKRMKVFECLNCFTIQNSPWFTKEASRRIYSNIYGQHNRSWQNVINFFTKGKLPNHGKLFYYLNKNIKIKNYGEFNSPFMGILINFFSIEYKLNKFFHKSIFKKTIEYLRSRQVAGKSLKFRKNSHEKSKLLLESINDLKKKNLIKNKTNKYLLIDNSTLFWGQNDNFNSVNSRTFANELLNLKIIDLADQNKKIKFDLFGIFHTLDHTFQPKKIFNYALDNSKYVIVYCHINSELEKQHLFSLTKKFFLYLKKNKIYYKDLTNIIDKKYNVPEMYFLCSKNRKLIN